VFLVDPASDEAFLLTASDLYHAAAVFGLTE